MNLVTKHFPRNNTSCLLSQLPLEFLWSWCHFYSIKSTVWVESSSFPAGGWRRKSGGVRDSSKAALVCRDVIPHVDYMALEPQSTPLECGCSALTHLQLNSSKFQSVLTLRMLNKRTAQNPRLLTFARGKACVLQKGSAHWSFPLPAWENYAVLGYNWRGHILWETTRCLSDLLSNTRG